MRFTILFAFLLYVAGKTEAIRWRQLTRIINYWAWGADTQGVASHPNLIELAQELNLTTCVNNLKEIGADKLLDHEGWYTLFCPTNEAFNDEKYFPDEETLTNKMRLHVARGLYNSHSFNNEKLLKSMLTKRNIRINIYPQKSGLVTANGQPVIKSDLRARNGYIHVISGVMTSVYSESETVITEIEHCCPEHSSVIHLAKKAGLYSKINQANPITFLVPTNAAFESLHPKLVSQLEKNITLLRKVLRAHILPGSWYTAGLSQGIKIKSWSGETVDVEMAANDTIRFSGATAFWANMNAVNGVTHVIQSLIIPKSAKKQVDDLLQALRQTDA